MSGLGAGSQAFSGRTTPHSTFLSLSADKDRAGDHPVLWGGYSAGIAPSSNGSSADNLQMQASSTESGESRRRRSHSSSPVALQQRSGVHGSHFSSRQSVRRGSISARRESASSRVSSLTKDSSIHSVDALKIEISDLTHLFGRAKEQQLLQDAFARSLKRDPDRKKEVVKIHGKAGTGKTALILDFKDAVSSTGAGYFCGGKFENDQSFAKPYSGIIQALNDLCEAISVGPDKDEKRKSLVDNLGFSRLNELSGIFLKLRDLITVPPSTRDDVDIGVTDGPNRGNSHGGNEMGMWVFRMHELPTVFRDFLRALCYTSHPIILSLDDLQWADEASLDCISSFIRDPMLVDLMVVGAFRDDEDRKCSIFDHPEQNVTDILLDNLPLASVHDILSDITGNPGVNDLAKIVLQKTHGNPFSIFQFLDMLQRKELLHFSFQTLEWVWDVEDIKSKTDVTQNVGHLLVKNITKLSLESRKLLTLSAAIGINFEPKVVELIAIRLDLLDSEYRAHLTDAVQGVIRDAVSGGLIHPDQTQAVMAAQLEVVEDGSTSSLKCSFYEESLQTAIQVAEVEGLIGKTVSRSKYKFAHDLLHKSFYEDSALDIERHELHLQIGRILRSFYETRPEDELLFAAVDHLNKGSHFIERDDERIDLVELNQRSSEKARARRALFSAASFSSKAIDLLKFEHDWMNHYDLLLHVYNYAAELNFACGRFDLSLRRCLEIHRHARNLHDKLVASYIRIEVLFSQRKTSDALNSCLAALKSLDEPLDKNPSSLQILGEWRKTRKMVRKLGSNSLLSLPSMHDAVKRQTQRYLRLLVNIAVVTVNDRLLPVAILRMFQNAMTHGMCDFTPFAMAGFGVLCTVLGNREEAIDYGEKAMQLCEKMESQICIPSTYAIFYSTLTPLRSPVVESIEPLMKAYRIGVGIGEVQHAAMCMSISASGGFYGAVPLKVYTEDLTDCCGQIKMLKQESILALIVPYWSAAMDLARAGKGARDLGERLFTDDAGSSGDELALIWWNHHMMAYIVAYIFNDYEAARVSRIKMNMHCETPRGTHFMVHFELLFSGLLDYALHRKTGSRIALRRAACRTRQMQRLSKKQGAVHCEGMSLLLRAELNTRRRRVEQAIRLYEESAKSFSKSAFLHLEAIAYERLAEFLKRRNRPAALWQHFVRLSIKHYAEWGASAKVNQLKEEYDMPAKYSMGGTPCPIITIQDESAYRFASITPVHTKEEEFVSTDISSELLTTKV